MRPRKKQNKWFCQAAESCYYHGAIQDSMKRNSTQAQKYLFLLLALTVGLAALAGPARLMATAQKGETESKSDSETESEKLPELKKEYAQPTAARRHRHRLYEPLADNDYLLVEELAPVIAPIAVFYHKTYLSTPPVLRGPPA
jgi:hypothetical protein